MFAIVAKRGYSVVLYKIVQPLKSINVRNVLAQIGSKITDSVDDNRAIM